MYKKRGSCVQVEQPLSPNAIKRLALMLYNAHFITASSQLEHLSIILLRSEKDPHYPQYPAAL